MQVCLHSVVKILTLVFDLTVPQAVDGSGVLISQDPELP